MQLALHNVSKRYGTARWALRDISLTLSPGVLGLLGPNGSGKSSLMRILTTITKPTAGTVTWNGADVVRFPGPLRSMLGYVPQDFGVYPNLTALEFLEYMAAVKGVHGAAARRRIAELVEALNLGAAARRPLGEFSGGMKQRVGIAQALLNDPQVLIADEPTVGLDPEERARFRQLLSDLAGDRIIILSTHIVSDVEALASAIAILDAGRLVAYAPPADLLGAAQGRVWTWTVPLARWGDAKDGAFVVTRAARDGDSVAVRAVAEGAPSDQAVPASPTLEDAYLYCLHAQSRSPGMGAVGGGL